MSDESRPPVMGDVARVAGVSHQTVSRVVNGHPHIRPATRARVEQAIDALGYRPNTAARALVSGRSGMLGIVVASGPLYGPRSAQHGVGTAARAAGFAVAHVELAAVTPADLRAAVEDLTRIGVEGIVVVAGHDAAVDVARARPGDLPVVVVEGDLSLTPMSVGVDQVAGARAAVEHLLDLGHDTVAHVAGPTDWAEARARAEGWRATLADAGRPVREPSAGDWTPASGYAAGRVLAADPEVTAVFVANDQMAMGVLRAVAEAGRRVPQDVSLVGFDDVPEAGYLVPPLTTVHQDFAEVGRRSVDLLVTTIRGEQPPALPLLTPRLVVRSSTAAPTTRHREARP